MFLHFLCKISLTLTICFRHCENRRKEVEAVFKEKHTSLVVPLKGREGHGMSFCPHHLGAKKSNRVDSNNGYIGLEAPNATHLFRSEQCDS